MSCVIDNTVLAIEFNKEEGKWFILKANQSDPLKIKNLSDCKFKSPMKELKISVQTEDQTTAQPHISAHKDTQPLILQNQPQVQQKALQMETTELPDIQGIMGLAGDSVWGGVVIFALVLLFKFMNKKMDQDSKNADDLSKQCTARHSEVSNKTDAVNKEIAALEKRINLVELELKYKLTDDSQKKG